MIATYAQNGHDKEALDVFQRMLSNGIKPNGATFVGVLTACSHAGRVDDGRQFFLSMSQEHDIRYTVEHYKCLLDILGRAAGHLDEAEDLIKTMPFQSEASVWLCLLAACRVHGDVERGVRAVGHIFKLDPGKAAPYILLSNVHAATGRNDNAEKL
ncbi:hypothetical protein O6H91_09G089300 [Diphasiastrum complanatum]|nr:hypothetical protein O6H91_09G089300 [Diphasiastrum complanatum]